MAKPKPLCRVCKHNPVHADGLCMADYQHRRRTGKVRTEEQIVAWGMRCMERTIERRLAS